MRENQETAAQGRWTYKKGKLCEGITFQEFSLCQAGKNRRILRHTEHSPDAGQRTDEEDTGPMVLLDEAR